MNVIVSNLNKDVFNGLDVDIIKSISGEFDADEIVQTFSNFFFNRMFLDITAIKEYNSFTNIQKLSLGLDVNKIIILLNDDPVVNSDIYLSKLVSMGIYNFAHNLDELNYLYNNPNSYKDVAHYQQVGNVIADSVQDVTTDIVTTDSSVRVIGIKNITEDAGSTSLVYMLKQVLMKYYSVVAIEVNKKDFMFYHDRTMISVRGEALSDFVLKYKDYNVILIDLNDLHDSVCHSVCNDVFYLIEPSLLKINKLITLNHSALSKYSREKVILNKSFFNKNDVKDFEFESGLKIFFNIPCLYDRVDNSNVLLPLLEKLGLFTKNY